jgi:hypothetical protein
VIGDLLLTRRPGELLATWPIPTGRKIEFTADLNQVRVVGYFPAGILNFESSCGVCDG